MTTDLRNKVQELIHLLQKMFCESYSDGMFFGYIFNQIVNFLPEELLDKEILIEEIHHEAEKREKLQKIIEYIFKKQGNWWDVFQKEEMVYAIAYMENITPKEVLKITSVEQAEERANDAIFCRGIDSEIIFSLVGNTISQQTLPEELFIYDKVSELLLEIKELIS